MPLPRVVAGMFSSAMMVLGAVVVSGQDYPNKPIRIVTGEQGGSTDFAARLLAQGLAPGLGQNIMVENRPSNLIGEYAAKAQSDGYTLLVAGGSFMMGPLLQRVLYDPLRDFSPITLATNSPSVLVVHPSVAVKSVKDLIELAKAKPGELNYASGATGGTVQLAAELFKSMAGVNIVRIPYKGQGPAIADLTGGHVQLMFSGASTVTPHIKSGRLNALAVTSAQPSALFPGLPTIASSGLPGYEAGSMQGLWAPTKTSTAITGRLNRETVQFLNRTDVKERLLATGVEAAPTSPEQFAALIKSDMARMGKLIKDAGIRVE